MVLVVVLAVLGVVLVIIEVVASRYCHCCFYNFHKLFTSCSKVFLVFPRFSYWVKKIKQYHGEKYFGPKYFLIFFPAVVLVVLGVVFLVPVAVARCATFTYTKTTPRTTKTNYTGIDPQTERG